MLVLFAIGSCVAMAEDGDMRRTDDRPMFSEMSTTRLPGEATHASSRETAPRTRRLVGEKLAQNLDQTLQRVNETSEAMVASGWGSWREWSSWCEDVERRSCETAADCTAGNRCVRPWWAHGERESERVCVRPWPSVSERSWRRDRLYTLVDLTCSARDGCDRNRLHEFLSLVALRESSWRPYKRHRLGPDVAGAHAALRRRARVYSDNAHLGETERWGTALGLYGQNPAIFVDAWDHRAPPETLCREVEATAAYLERARRAVRAYERRGIDPTLCDVHRAVSGGRLETCVDDGGDFGRRARRSGIDPTAPVDEADFGEPPPKEIGARLAWAEALHSALEAKHPRPRLRGNETKG